MTITVGPTERHPTHDMKLTDGTTTIGLHLCDGKGTPTPLGIRQGGVPRTSLQIRQGDPDYSSYEMPYTPMTQKDWSGGRGQEDFAKDSTKFYDSYRVDTRGGDMVLGPQATEVTFPTTITKTGSTQVGFGNDPSIPMGGGYNPIASSFVPAATVTAASISITIDVTAVGGFSFSICANDTNKPGTVLAHAEYNIASTGVKSVSLALDTNITLTASTTYWFMCEGNGGRNTGAVGAFAYKGTNTGCTFLTWSLIGAAWNTGAAESNTSIAFDIHPVSLEGSILFEYKGIVMCVGRVANSSAPKLFARNRYGYATTNATDKSVTNTTSTTAVSHAGAILRITEGPGSTEETPWRSIVSNSTGSNISYHVNPAWTIAQTTDTLWVELNFNDNWTEITGHGLTGYVTDVLVVDGIIYFCQGDAIAIRRGQYTTAGWAWADDGTNKATFLTMVNDTTGTRKIWRANATTAKAASSDVKAWGTNLAFGTDVTCGNAKSRITGLQPYGNPSIPWVLKEDSIGSISNNVYAQIPLSEMYPVKDERNGRAHCQFGVYLMFSMLNGLERYYDSRLDDIGPNLAEGLPTTRQGCIYQMIPYPGGIFASVDAGPNGYSAILFWNQLGWHEIYRSSVLGSRILGMLIQVLPGEIPDRLWFTEGYTSYWIPLSLNPRKQTGYTYYTGDDAYVISSWFTGGFKEIIKFWKSLYVFAEGLSSTVKVRAYYQTDTATDASAWTALPTDFTTSPVQEVQMAATPTVTGKRWRYKLVLYNNTSADTPRIKAVTVESVTRLPIKRSWTISFLADDAMRQISAGEAEPLTADGLITQLMTWADAANRAAPLTMNHNLATYDNRNVFIDPLSINLLSVQLNETRRVMKAVCVMTMYEA